MAHRNGKKSPLLTLALIVALVIVAGVAWRDSQGQAAADAAAQTLMQSIDDVKISMTPEWVQQTLGRQPTETYDTLEEPSNRKLHTEVYSWPGVGRTHTLYVTYIIGATRLALSVSRDRPQFSPAP